MVPRDLCIGAGGIVAPPIDSVIKSAQRNERQGFDTLWWPDHLMSWWPQSIWEPALAPIAGILPSPHIHLDPVATIAAVGVNTERVVLGTSVTEAIRRPPAMLAQEFLTLDHITKGRVILGLGAGEACNITPYGLHHDRPLSRLEEAIKIIRLIWEHDGPVDFDGQFWKLHGAVNGMRPYQPDRYPPIWVGGQAPRTMRIIAQLADGWLPGSIAFDQWKECKRMIERAARAAGRDASQITCGLYYNVVIDRDHEQCHRMLQSLLLKDFVLPLPSAVFERYGYKHPLSDNFGDNYHGNFRYIPSLMQKERMLQVLEAVPFEVVHDHTAHGTPEDVAAFFDRYVQAGCRHIVLENISFVADLSKTRSSFQLLYELLKYLKGLA